MKLFNPIGAHISVGDGYLESFRMAVAIGAEAMQIFAKSPMQAKLRAVTSEESREVREFADREKVRAIVIHASYLLNFSKPLVPDTYEIKS